MDFIYMHMIIICHKNKKLCLLIGEIYLLEKKLYGHYSLSQNTWYDAECRETKITL